MKRTIAIYQLYGSGEVFHQVDEYTEADKDYTRLTEPQEITFIERDHAKVVKDEVDRLKEKREKIRAELGAKIAQVEDDIQKLMAIEHSTTDET